MAKWDPQNHRVAFVYGKFIAEIENCFSNLPHRYRDPEKSTSFVHFNIFKDVKRGIRFHMASKIHKDVTSICVTQVDSEIYKQEEEKWVNTAWLACKNLLRLNPASNFKNSVAQARQVGGVVLGEAHANTPFYNSCLELLENIEARTLKKEMSGSPFTVFVFGLDTDKNLAAVCVAFFTADFQIATRVIRVEKWHKAKHETERKAACCAVLSDSMADAGTTLQHMSACVQTVDRHHVMAEIQSQSQRCLPFWCSGHHDDLALRDQWEAPNTQGLLYHFDSLFRYFIKCLNDTVHVEDELRSCVSMLPACPKTLARSSWNFPNTCKWDTPKPYICSLADDYPVYIRVCVF